MSPATVGLAAAACLLAVIVAFSKGYGAGTAAAQREWQAERDAQRAELDAKAREGFELAQGYQKQLAQLRTQNAHLQARRQSATELRVDCPASGVVGDVVLPAELVRSMFNTGQPRPSVAASAPD